MPALVVAGGLLHVRGRGRAIGHRGRDRAGGRSVGARLIGPVSIIAGSASLQGAAALAAGLFVVFGAAGTSALRFLAGAVVLRVRASARARSRRPMVASERVGRDSAGLEGRALAVAAAALVTLPIGAPAAASGVDAGQLTTVAALGVLGVAVPYALFLHAIRQVGARTYSVLLSLDPAVAMLAGLLVLSESPRLADAIGVALVTAASARP